MKTRLVCCPSCDAPIVRLALEGQKAVQLVAGPPSAPTSVAGVADVSVEHRPHTPAEGRAQLLIDTLVALVERAEREIPNLTLRAALRSDLRDLLAEHGRVLP